MSMGKNTERAIEKTPFTFMAMIDIVFLLLIFFMLAAKFKQPEERIDALLPNVGPAPIRDHDPEPLSIFVKDDQILRKSNDYKIQSSRLATYYLASRDGRAVRNPAELLPVLRQLASNPEQRVLIALYDETTAKDQRVPFFNIINLLDICKEAGIDNVSFQAPAQIKL